MTLSVSIKARAGNFPVEVAFASGPGITVLFGHSGAGKTTVLKAIAGMLKPEEGRIVLGETVFFDSDGGNDIQVQRRRTGFVFQDGRLFPHLSVARNLRYASWAARRRSPRDFDEVVELLGLRGHLDRMPAGLSGGERQRVAIGRALLSDPAILLMDEPLSSLDNARRQEILPYLEAVRDEAGIPIVYVSHEIGEVARLADTLVVMSEGRTVASGPGAEVFARLDLGPALGRHEASVLIEGRVQRLDDHWGTVMVDVDGQTMELAATDMRPGHAVRLRVRARDVAVARERPSGLSIRNCLAASVAEIVTDDGPFAELSLLLGQQKLRARVTRKSVAELDLKVGDPVHALLKAISVERRAMIWHSRNNASEES